MAKETKIKFKVLSLSVKEDNLNWVLKIASSDPLTEVRQEYQARIEIDEEYFKGKAASLQQDIDNRKAKPDMFEDWKAEVKNLTAAIKEVGEEKVMLKLLEIKDFKAIVDVADFSKNTMSMDIPEEIVPDLIKLRSNIDKFIVNLK